MTQNPPWQELVAKDLHANEWHFRHIFRGELILPSCLILLQFFSATIFSQDNLGGIYLQLAGVFLLAQNDWLLVMHLSF